MKTSRKELKLRTLAQKRQLKRGSVDYYSTGQVKLMARRFMKNKLAIGGLAILIIIYMIALLAEFVAPYDPNMVNEQAINMPPQSVICWFDENGLVWRPYVYKMVQSYDPITLETIYVPDTSVKYYVEFFTTGPSYKLWGLIPSNIHLFGVEGEGVMLSIFGTDSMGRDIFTRICYGARISCTIGFVGVLTSFILGIVIGGLSAYFGGWFDALVQRIIDFLVSLPTLPIWMALSAAIPTDWSVTQTYFCMVLILSFMGWPGLARVVRSKFLSLSNEDFIKAAKVSGAGMGRIIFKHMMPSFASYLIAQMTLSIPGMILGETSMSFLGLGLRSPAVSWGILLSDAQSMVNIALYPWVLIPSIFVILTIMAFNFVGDGLRDAADPYA